MRSNPGFRLATAARCLRVVPSSQATNLRAKRESTNMGATTMRTLPGTTVHCPQLRWYYGYRNAAAEYDRSSGNSLTHKSVEIGCPMKDREQYSTDLSDTKGRMADG